MKVTGVPCSLIAVISTTTTDFSLGAIHYITTPALKNCQLSSCLKCDENLDNFFFPDRGTAWEAMCKQGDPKSGSEE